MLSSGLSRLLFVSLLMPLFTQRVEAADPQIARLPGEGTFAALEQRLEALKKAPFSNSMKKDTAAQDILLKQGRLQLAAGKLKQAGYLADRIDRNLQLIELRVKNAALSNTLQKLADEANTLSQRIAALKEKLSAPVDAAVESDENTPLRSFEPTEPEAAP